MRDVITCRYHGFENGVVVRIPDYLIIDVGFATVNFNAQLGNEGNYFRRHAVFLKRVAPEHLRHYPSRIRTEAQRPAREPR